MEDYEEIVRVIQDKILAEQAAAAELRRQNDLAEKALVELQRNRQAEQQRMRLAFDTSDKVSGLYSALQKAFRDIRTINRRLGEAERRAEQIQDVLLLLLTEKSPQKVQEGLDDLEAEIAERETNRRKLELIHTRNLSRLNRQAAYYGLRVPLELMNEIEVEQQNIRDLQKPPGNSPGEGSGD